MFSIGLISCQEPDQEPTVQDFQLTESNIVLVVGETHVLEGTGITINSAYSENEWIVTIDKTTITAQHPGITNIVINDKKCSVTVKGKYNSTCYEPFTQWGASKSTVKSYMGIDGITYSTELSFYDETNNLEYQTYFNTKDNYNVDFYIYIFDYLGNLIQAQAFFSIENNNNYAFISGFLKERYIDLDYENLNEGIIKAYTTFDYKTAIVWMSPSALNNPWAPIFPENYWCLVYYPVE